MVKVKYNNYLRSIYWLAVKRKVLLRDRFTCQDCGKKRLLQVHHLTYEHLGKEMAHLEDLVTLCKPCHEARHGIKRKTIVPKKKSVFKRKDKPTKQA